MRAGEIDDDRGCGRIEPCGPVVRETGEHDVGAGGERLVVRDEARQRAVQAVIERGCGLTGERIGAERDDLELRMPEDAVECLLSGVPGRTEDRRRGHFGILL